ncbi:MAG: CotH kinase family protein [Bacteroidales bacterium]|nr:CotH kinase family protein [Bacteroidales bacterium]
MKKVFLLHILLCFFINTYSQDISGFQKLRGEIIASESNDVYNTPKYFAFDTDENTCFRAKNLKGWVGLDLKQPYNIKKIRLFPRKEKPERLLGAIIQGANKEDFSDAQNLFTIIDTPSPYHYTIYTIENISSFRYVRCYCPNTYCNVADIEFYANPDSQIREYKQLTNLPSIYLETAGNFDFVDKSVYAENSKVFVASNDGVQSFPASIKGRGNSTWDYLTKKSFRIKFDKKQHFLNLPANAKNWTLISSHVDKTFLRNGLTFEMAKNLEFEFTPVCVFADVFLDGFYYGTYFVSDQIDVRENRIDIQEMTPQDNQMPELSGGYHLEVDGYAKLEPVYFTTPQGVDITIKSPEDDLITEEQKNYIKNHVYTMESVLYSDPERACTQYIDIKSAVSYYLISEISGNCDSFWCFHCYKKRNDDKLYFGPVWDFDQAYLNDGRMSLEKSILDVNFGFKQWFPRIMNTKIAKEELKRQWNIIIDNGVEAIMNDYIDENSRLINDSQILNYERWMSLNQKIFTNIFVTDTYQGYIDYLKDYLVKRFIWADEQVKYFCADNIVILPTSEDSSNRYLWKTSLDTPPVDWYSVSFNDNTWKSQLAPFGTINVCTSWTSSDIYIRRSFNVADDVIDNLQSLILSIFYDEDSEVYINGVLAAQFQNYLVGYNKYKIDKSLLKKGNNVIAVHCHQTEGGQYIDAGLIGVVSQPTLSNDIEADDVNYYVDGRTIFVNDVPQHSVVNIYSLSGILVYSNINSGTSFSKEMPYSGIYILNINGKSEKFTVAY